jgi:abhydrolase domain-containing protein 17
LFKWNILTQLLIYYSLATFIIYFVSDYFIFPIPQSSYLDKDLHTIKLNTSDGNTISALYLKQPSAEYTVLFSHGNGEDLGDIFSYLRSYQQHGFSIFAYDYHGYGTSTGKPSESNTYLDIDTAYRYLTETLKIPTHQIILHGRSIGSGPTLELALHKQVRGIILESAMLSAFQVVTIIPLLPVDKFRNNMKITRIETPMLFIHGTKDQIIPFWHGKRLYEMAKVHKVFFSISNAGHNNLVETAGQSYWSQIQKFSQSL